MISHAGGRGGSTRRSWIWQQTPLPWTSLSIHVQLGPSEHTCRELKSIWIGEKMYSSVTVEANEAGRTECPSLDSSQAGVVPSSNQELTTNATARIWGAIKHVDYYPATVLGLDLSTKTLIHLLATTLRILNIEEGIVRLYCHHLNRPSQVRLGWFLSIGEEGLIVK